MDLDKMSYEQRMEAAVASLDTQKKPNYGNPTVEPLYKHTVGNRIRMLIREVCLCRGN